jgi:hypothetical protein
MDQSTRSRNGGSTSIPAIGRTGYILCGPSESEVCADWRIVHRQMKEYSVAKAQDAKKETKKKPEKTLKEKRVEKQAKKSSKGG